MEEDINLLIKCLHHFADTLDHDEYICETIKKNVEKIKFSDYFLLKIINIFPSIILDLFDVSDPYFHNQFVRLLLSNSNKNSDILIEYLEAIIDNTEEKETITEYTELYNQLKKITT